MNRVLRFTLREKANASIFTSTASKAFILLLFVRPLSTTRPLTGSPTTVMLLRTAEIARNL